MVAKEVVFLFPRAHAVEFLPADFVQVNEGYSIDGGNVGSPFRLGLAHNSSFLIVGVARSQRHEDRIGTGSTNILDVATQVVTVTVDGVLPLRALVEADVAGVHVNAGDDGTSPTLVEELAVVIMADADDNPIALLQSLTDGRPEVGIKGTCRHTAQGLVFDRNHVCVEILLEEISPSPLAVVAVA